ncbi:lipocalin family protein [Sphingobacterium sp. T2]|uniref:lipocalin family protein n=1 Tax=Sphingobacterium sp. T2 TaxID=1590596 RepID=UPI0021D0F9D8|nr:lipocalin family protein [Sphingobacterium sp. T2]
MLLLIGASFVLTTSCLSIPKSATVIKDFDASKYVGTWYEIARIDFKHERNLNNTTAQYSLKDNGDIKVVNSGFNYLKNEMDSTRRKCQVQRCKKYRSTQSVVLWSLLLGIQYIRSG